jgi:hypothetical protein
LSHLLKEDVSGVGTLEATLELDFGTDTDEYLTTIDGKHLKSLVRNLPNSADVEEEEGAEDSAAAAGAAANDEGMVNYSGLGEGGDGAAADEASNTRGSSRIFGVGTTQGSENSALQEPQEADGDAEDDSESEEGYVDEAGDTMGDVNTGRVHGQGAKQLCYTGRSEGLSETAAVACGTAYLAQPPALQTFERPVKKASFLGQSTAAAAADAEQKAKAKPEWVDVNSVYSISQTLAKQKAAAKTETSTSIISFGRCVSKRRVTGSMSPGDGSLVSACSSDAPLPSGASATSQGPSTVSSPVSRIPAAPSPTPAAAGAMSAFPESKPSRAPSKKSVSERPPWDDLRPQLSKSPTPLARPPAGRRSVVAQSAPEFSLHSRSSAAAAGAEGDGAQAAGMPLPGAARPMKVFEQRQKVAKVAPAKAAAAASLAAQRVAAKRAAGIDLRNPDLKVKAQQGIKSPEPGSTAGAAGVSSDSGAKAGAASTKNAKDEKGIRPESKAAPASAAARGGSKATPTPSRGPSKSALARIPGVTAGAATAAGHSNAAAIAAAATAKSAGRALVAVPAPPPVKQDAALVDFSACEEDAGLGGASMSPNMQSGRLAAAAAKAAMQSRVQLTETRKREYKEEELTCAEHIRDVVGGEQLQRGR